MNNAPNLATNSALNAGDPFEQFKAQQKKGWAFFAPLEASTTMPAAQLVEHAGVRAGQRVLDVACGTGVVSVTAARLGASVTGFDLTPELLDRARQNAQLAATEIEFREGDVENLPFADSQFDIVLSQFGHIFAPRPAIAIAQMLRVLKPGGTIAFSTWPPDRYIGRIFALRDGYLPLPSGVPSPMEWGDRAMVERRLGNGVRDVVFASGTMLTPALSPQHVRAVIERAAGPMVKLVEVLSASDPNRLAEFRREYDALTAEYIQGNALHQVFLMTRATKS